MEKLAFPFELEEANPDEGTFSGRAIVYGREFNTLFGPLIIEPGAFADSISRNRDRMVILWQHERREPVGKALELEDRPDGVHVKGKLSMTTRGKDALTLLRDQVVSELSAGVERVEELDEKGKIRRLRKGEIHEISLVTFGAAGKEGAKIYEVHEAAEDKRKADLPLSLRLAMGYAAELEAKYGPPPPPPEKPPTIPTDEIAKVCAPCGELFKSAGVTEVEVERFIEAMESLLQKDDS